MYRVSSLSLRMAAGFSALLLCAFAASATQAPPFALAIAGTITPGKWRIVSKGLPTRLICLSDITVLVQLEHSGLSCPRLIIENESDHATLHYSCAAAGWGRTTLTVMTPRLVLIDSQGIAGKAPFAFDAEARRVGSCGDSAQVVRH